MASWEQELDHILADLDVQQEHSPAEQSSSSPEQEMGSSIMQLSLAEHGVLYRLDITDTAPELRVFAPTNEGA